jgi:hypothetical protein
MPRVEKQPMGDIREPGPPLPPKGSLPRTLQRQIRCVRPMTHAQNICSPRKEVITALTLLSFSCKNLSRNT